MKIVSMKLPKFVSYYLSENVIDEFTNTLLNSNIEIRDDKIYLYSNNNIDITNMLLVLKNKSERTTLGNKCLYEYELDINIPDGHIFEFITDNGNSYKGTLLHVGNTKSGELQIIFTLW